MIRKVSPDGFVTPGAFNALVDAVTQLANMYAAPPLELSKVGGRIGIRLNQKGFMAKITVEIGGGVYTVEQCQPSGSGSWVPVTGGVTLDAYEWNKTTGLPLSRIVWVEPEDNGDFRFYDVNPTGTGITLGCHLGYDGDGHLQVTADSLPAPAPSGLKVVNGDCKTLALDLGCHLGYSGDNHLQVTPGSLAGQGLDVQTGSCPSLKVKTGCHLGFDGSNAIEVTPGTLAGYGLTTQSGSCYKLAVNTGCGITIDGSNRVKFYPADVAGNGLTAVDPCKLSVVPGCGIKIDGLGAVAVAYDELVGCSGSCGIVSGLGACEPSSGDCGCLYVNTGCGLTIDAATNKVKVKPEDLAEPNGGLAAVTEDGKCSLRVDYNCGLVIDEGGQLSVDPNALAGNGLAADTDEGACQLRVKTGCGIKIDSGGQVAVHLPELVTCSGSCGIASGLVVCEPSSGCPCISVNVGCGLKLDTDDNKVKVKPDDLAEPNGGLVAVTEDGKCSLRVDYNCGLTIDGGGQLSVDNNALVGDGLKTGPDCSLEVKPYCGISVDSNGVSVHLNDFVDESGAGGLQIIPLGMGGICDELQLYDPVVCLEVVVPPITCNPDGTLSYSTKYIVFRGRVEDTQPVECD